MLIHGRKRNTMKGNNYDTVAIIFN